MYKTNQHQKTNPKTLKQPVSSEKKTTRGSRTQIFTTLDLGYLGQDVLKKKKKQVLVFRRQPITKVHCNKDNAIQLSNSYHIFQHTNFTSLVIVLEYG